MKRIVLDLQSQTTAQALERILLQDLPDFRPIPADTPSETAEQCRLFRPGILLMDVTARAPRTLSERLALCAEIRQQDPTCRVILFADEHADAGLAAQVVRCRNNDQIDGFLFRSASEKYTAALLDGLYPRRKEYYME